MEEVRSFQNGGSSILFKLCNCINLDFFKIIDDFKTIESLDHICNKISYRSCETSDKSVVESSKKIKLHDCPVTTTLIGRGLEAINQSANRTTHEDQVAVNNLYLFHKGVGNDFFLVTGYCCNWLSMEMKSIPSGEKVGTYT